MTRRGYDEAFRMTEEARRRNGQPTDGDPAPLAGRVLLAQGIEEGIEPPEELEPDVLLAGRVHSVYAASGTGKTWMMLWLIKQAIERGEKVVVFDQENGPRIVAERLAALGVPTEDLDEKLHYYSYPSLTLDEEATAAYTTLLEEVGPSLVVFDSWINFLASAGLEENSSNDVASWAVHYTHPARSRGAAVLLLDHVPHDHGHSRGSTRKRDEVDVMWALKNPMPFDRDMIGRITLHREKDREGWLPERVGFSVGGTAGGFIFRRSEGTIEEPDPTDGLTPSARKVLDTLAEDFGAAPLGASAAEWRKAAGQRGVSEPTFYRALRTIKARELVIVRGKRYFPLPSPPDGGGSDSEKPRIPKPDPENYHKLSEHYHDSGDSGGGRSLSSLSPPFRGDSDDSSADSLPGGGGSGPDEAAAFLADPPAWLAAQLGKCREDPDRLLNSTATAIAAELYNSPMRWREVRPVLKEYLKGGAPAA